MHNLRAVQDSASSEVTASWIVHNPIKGAEEESLTSQEWHNISRFESYDLVKSWYQETHKRQPNATKTKQINAFFIQGKEYFRSASS